MIVNSPTTIADVRHPDYTANFVDWQKYRDVYIGGQHFIERYLEKFSLREGEEDFKKRKRLSYNPAFAKEAVDEIKNSIFQRFVDITRAGGSISYQLAMAGQKGGVDLLGSSMNCYIGKKILPELLPMGRVGIYVDMPELPGEASLIDVRNKRPYIYLYRTEDICSWIYDENENSNEFVALLLKDYINTYDDKTGLPAGIACRYRRFWLESGVVRVQKYMDDGQNDGEIQTLNIPKIPFYLADIGASLLAECANYQITLLNMASADVAYALTANMPTYVEQYDPKPEMGNFIRPPGETGDETTAQTAKQPTAKTGTRVGRRYPVGTERPGYIHPSSEPLKASMEKQEQMKRDIRELVNLSIANIDPKMASAESKSLDKEGLESGLSYIGLELENMERKIAEFWAMYENSTVATVAYPEVYKIKTQAEKDTEAAALEGSRQSIPSITFQKEACKKIAKLTIGRDVENITLDKIMGEIDDAKSMTADSTIIMQDVEVGLVDLETASEARFYPKGSAKKAANDHAERLACIAESQAAQDATTGGAARGVPDKSGKPGASGSPEKKASLDTTKDPVVKDKQRGKGQ